MLQEWYDYEMEVARTDYMPFNHYDIGDPLGGNSGYVKDVKDFSTGVVYSVNREFGNCTVMHIGQDFSGDVTINGDGTIHMSSPFDFWHVDQLYTLNGAVRKNTRLFLILLLCNTEHINCNTMSVPRNLFVKI
jgi:hypothetical protein